MEDDPNLTDWAPGQLPPWLDAYGPAPGAQPLGVETAQYPVGGLIAGTIAPGQQPPPLPAPPPPPAPTPAPPAPQPAPDGKTSLGAKGRNSIGLFPGSPTGEETQFVPPWLQQQAPQPAASPELTPDAISGAPQTQSPETPDQTLGRIAVDPNAPLTDRQKAWASLPAEQRLQIVNSGDPEKLAAIATASMSPEELATIGVRHQQAQMHLQSAQQLTLAQKADEDARRNYETYQSAVQAANASTTQLMADAQKLSQEKIDPNEHGVGHFVASVLTGLVGGAASPYTGGRNLALEELDKQTQRRIDAQHQNIQNGMQAIGLKRNLIAEQLQRSGDLYHATETYRLSQLNRAEAELQTRMQDYDPQGTTNLRSLGVVQQIQAQRAKMLQDYNQQVFKNKLDIAKAQNEALQQQETVRHNKASEGIDWSRLSIDKQKAAVELQQFTPEQLTALYPGAPVPQIPMTPAQYGTFLENTNKGQTAVKAQRENAASDVATAIHSPVTGKPLQVGEQVIRAATPEIADKINTQSQYAQAFLDAASAARRELAAGPSSFNKEKYAEIRTNLQDALKDFALANGLKYSSREAEALQDVLGTDFKDFRDRLWSTGKSMKSLDTIIGNVRRDNMTGLKARFGYDGPDPLLETANPEPAAPLPTDDLIKQLSEGDRAGDPSLELNRQVDKIGRDNPEAQRALALSIPPSKLQVLDQLFEQAQGGDQNALAALQTVAEGKTANTFAPLRSYARALVSSALGSNTLTDVANGTTPPPAPEGAQ